VAPRKLYINVQH